MTPFDIARHRLRNQQIVHSSFERPGDVVAWMGAMQGQDYPGAKWSVALRLGNATDSDIEQAINNRGIVRTWALRGTLHLVAPADVRWMLDLLQHRLEKGYAFQYRNLGLDPRTLLKTNALLEKALEGGHQLGRRELAAILEQKGIAHTDVRMGFILLYAATQKLICLGSRKGKEFTYTLLDEWIPGTRPLSHDEALARLTARYFNSHGPATIKDYSWWSGLTLTEARRGLEMVQKDFEAVVSEGQEYWMPRNTEPLRKSTQVQLLPGFDEFVLGYADRSPCLEEQFNKLVTGSKNGLFSATVVTDGQVRGTWRRDMVKKENVISVQPFTSFTPTQQKAITAAVKRYGTFSKMPAVLA